MQTLVTATPLAHDEHHLSIGWGIVLSILTLGIYNIYWNYRQFQTMNLLLSRREYDFWLWLILSILTCGIFHVYYEWKMGGDLVKVLKTYGHEVPGSIQAVGLLLSVFGLTVVADAVYQHEINKMCVNKPFVT